jgi:RNA polymerase sigma-70 factor (ECF subfamily)
MSPLRAQGPTRAQDLSDEEAISLVLSGDAEAFAVLVRRHRSKVMRLGMSFFHDEDEAEDFAQDVFVKAYTALASFKGRSSFSTWLLRIAYNTAVNAKERKREVLPLDSDEDLPGSPGADVTQAEEEEVAAVRAAMAGLPPRQALCVELFFYYNLKYAEIGEITGFPVNTIKSHVFRAKKILREKLARERLAGDGDKEAGHAL